MYVRNLPAQEVSIPTSYQEFNVLFLQQLKKYQHLLTPPQISPLLLWLLPEQPHLADGGQRWLQTRWC